MPDRLLARSLAFRWVFMLVMVVVVTLGITATLYAYRGADAVAALKTANARSECARRIQLQQEDDFRHRIGDALGASVNRDPALLRSKLAEIQSEEPTQHKIDRLCPEPLVQSKPKETP